MENQGKLNIIINLHFFICFTISCNQKGPVTLKMHQTRFSPGLRPGPRWGSSWRSPRVPSRLRSGILSPHSPTRRRLWRLTLSLKHCSKDLGVQTPLNNTFYRMQVNLRSSLCITAVFLYCYGHRKKRNFAQSLRKYADLTLRFKIFF